MRTSSDKAKSIGVHTIGGFMNCSLFQRRDNGRIYYEVLKGVNIQVIPASDGMTVTVSGKRGQTINPPLTKEVMELFNRNRTAQK